MIRLLFFFILIINSFALADDWGEITELELSQTQRSTSNFSNYWDEHFYGSLSGMTFGQNHSRYASEFKLGFS